MHFSIHKKSLILVVAIVAAAFVMIPAREAKATWDTYSEIQVYGGEAVCPPHGCSPPFNLARKLCLDSVNAGPNGSGYVQQVKCSGASTQQWTVTYNGNDANGYPTQVISQVTPSLQTWYLEDDYSHSRLSMSMTPGLDTGIWGLFNGILFSDTQSGGYCVQANGLGSGVEVTFANGCYPTENYSLTWLPTVHTGTDYVYLEAGGYGVNSCLSENDPVFTVATCVSGASATNEEFILTNEGYICNSGGNCLGYNLTTGAVTPEQLGTSGYDFQWWLNVSTSSSGAELANAESVCLQYTASHGVQAASCGGSNELWYVILGSYK